MELVRGKLFRGMLLLAWLGAVALTIAAARADSTWVYAVQISAVVETAPPRILLSWQPDQYGAISYTIRRKSKEDLQWGTGVTLPGSVSNYVDDDVVLGMAYEYEIQKESVVGYVGYGYIHAGIEAPLVEQRGKLILMVANNHADSLSNELARLETDLVGDGWQVIRHDVATNETPASIRALIINDYNSDPLNVKGVFLFGHVPVLYSGNLDYDGHGSRPMPSDAFYGDVDGDWSGGPNYLPSDLELMVGRVDFFNMPGVGSSTPWPTEVELLRNYLNKDHRWRHNQIQVRRRALIGDRRGEEKGEAVASTGYRNFEPLVGPGNTVLADSEDNSFVTNRWMPKLASEDYLWAYGCGGGLPAGISHLGTHGQYFEAWSIDVVDQDAKAVFVMMFGSWFGNWETTDNFMRSFLATPTMGLTAAIAGRPHWYVHHMGLGETIGYGARLSLNNSTLYKSHVNPLARSIYGSLQGDPTLRMDPVQPPAGLRAAANEAGVILSWMPSSESVLGYHVYRSGSGLGPFVRLNASLVTTMSFSDTDTNSTLQSRYMVRAVKLETTPSGSYFNASQGIFALVEPPIRVVAARAADGLALSWNAQPGKAYRVLAKTDLDPSAWADVSGSLVTSNASLSWTDTNSLTQPQKFYRIVSP